MMTVGARLPAKASVLTMEIRQFDGQFSDKRAPTNREQPQIKR